MFQVGQIAYHENEEWCIVSDVNGFEIELITISDKPFTFWSYTRYAQVIPRFREDGKRPIFDMPIRYRLMKDAEEGCIVFYQFKGQKQRSVIDWGRWSHGLIERRDGKLIDASEPIQEVFYFEAA